MTIDIGDLICYHCQRTEYKDKIHVNHPSDLCDECLAKYNTLSQEEKVQWDEEHKGFQDWQADMRLAYFGHD